MDGGVALQVVALVPEPEKAERLPGRPPEAGVGRQCDRDVDVEDPLPEALERRVRHPVERKRQPSEEQDEEVRQAQPVVALSDLLLRALVDEGMVDPAPRPLLLALLNGLVAGQIDLPVTSRLLGHGPGPLVQGRDSLRPLHRRAGHAATHLPRRAPEPGLEPPQRREQPPATPFSTIKYI